MSARGDDGHDFMQYGEMLEKNGYTRVFQIADEGKSENGARDLISVCEGMTLGVAKLLIKYAKSDCEALLKKEADVRRRAAVQGPI